MSLTVNKWSGVSVAMQSALATADTITGITLANPGVVTATAHGITSGSYVKLSIVGMNQLNGRVVRVANVTTDTFELEGVDTTSFNTFTSGTAEAITYGTTLATVVGVSGSGGDFGFIDTTTIHDNTKTQIPSIANAMTFSFDNIWDTADTALLAMKAASDAQAQRCFMIQFGTGHRMVFNGYVGASLIPGGSAQDKVTTKVDITAFGAATYYAS